MKQSQQKRLRAYLDSGRSITRLESFNELGLFELSARICELQREDYPINKERIKVTNRFGEVITVVKYSKRK